MDFIYSFIVSFSMYSALPMPQFEWNQKNLRYTLVFFPLVGLAVGMIDLLWWSLCGFLQFNNILFAVGFTVIPALVTGGIHFDGFCDTMDALASHAPKMRRLEILKDSNSGAFAIIGLACYFIVYFGFASQLKPDLRILVVLTIAFMLSRTLSGLSISSFRCAKRSGLVYTFANAADKRTVWLLLCTVTVVLIVGAFICDFPYAAAIMFACALIFLYYRAVSYQLFGGITGDLAGFFLVLCELTSLAGIVIVQSLPF
jgi:adenosylcobinamide-GDP ribazoletransferase